jgi:hypothetical protein
MDLSTCGFLEFDPDRGCQWINTDKATNHHFVKQNQGYKDELSDYLNRISKVRQRSIKNTIQIAEP